MVKGKFFSKNMIGMLLIFSTVLSFVFSIDSLLYVTILVLSSLIGTSFATSCFSHMKFKIIISILFFLSLYGFFLVHSWAGSPLGGLGIVFLGLGLGGLSYSIFITQALMQNESSNGFNLYHCGIFLSASSCAGFLFWQIFKGIPFGNIALLCSLLYCVCILSMSNPALCPYVYTVTEHKRYRKNRMKICFFFLIISSSTALIWTIINTNQPPENYNHYFIAGMVLGPLLISFFSRKKGIYSGCVLLIFLAETALMCASLYSHVPALQIFGSFATGILITGSISMCPALTFYMLGPISFYQNLRTVMTILFAGFSAVYPISFVDTEVITSTEATMWLIIFLLVSFFTLFSAWSHRLVLLK